MAISFASDRVIVQKDVYLTALIIYLSFSILTFHLRTISKKGNYSIDQGINYSLSFAIVTGPFGLFIFESVFRIAVYFYKKITNTDDPEEFIHIFYNIGSFVLQYSIAYIIFKNLSDSFLNIHFGYWILMFLLVTASAILSDMFLIIMFAILREIRTRQEIIHFIKSRSVIDMGKSALTNGLLIVFLQEGKWEMLLGLFILNYLVSHSFISKSIFLENKIERDKFEQMAYTDFLTGVNNRAFMDKKMAELNQSKEWIGIVVADIDKFKRINDNYNHAVGDQVIQHFAATLKSYLKKEDLLFRSGGEEFTIFLLNRKYEQTETLLNLIRQGVENSTVSVDYNGVNVSISYTSSFGLYYFHLNDSQSMEKGYVQADQLMYESKQKGKNQLSAKGII
ncbi:GGDEF domain-containing protein [Bacillus sp. UNCCL13]|uniref:GGDEF domain-containing protein n=1 Tax=Bacillus sp. UNCCL13 TaxID=1502772 RepID=UPI0020C877E8|nr:GGDEF domain-containing protein [Bacillus sp. UNCCL13]